MFKSISIKFNINVVLVNNLMSFILSLFIFYEVVLSGHICLLQGPVWINSGLLKISFGFLFDPLSVTMVLLVGFISLLVQLYSKEYMSSDPHILRFFGYLNLFTFFMLF